MNITCHISKIHEADVTVVGGGTAGVFAAIAAAKTGARTVLIEKNSILGGTMTSAGVNFPGLFFAWGKQIIDGPCWQAVQRTLSLGGGKMPEISYKPERHWHQQIRLNRFLLTTVLFQMCEEAGVEVLCNAMISAALEKDNCLQLIITGKNGMFAIHTRTAVDATGDANLAHMLGYPVEKSKCLQPGTLQNHISGYSDDSYRLEEIKEKMVSADLPSYITWQDLQNYLILHTIRTPIPCTDADTSAGKTAADRLALFTTLKIYRFLRTVNGLENLTVDFFGAETGIRETNRIIGETVISAEDYVKGTFYPDSVCYAFYPIDLHTMDGIKQTFHAEGIVSKIPYSALIPLHSRRLLCAGRCISSDTYANSAIRVEAVCMADGQAAGCAAALAALDDLPVSEVDYPKLCKALENIQAIVPKQV